MRIMYDDIRCELVSEGTSWSPDVANDMVARIKDLWQAAMTTIVESGAYALRYANEGIDWDDDDDEDVDDADDGS